MLGLGVDSIINSYLNNTVPVILLTGQSNAQGTGLNSSASGGETGDRSNVKIWSKSSGDWETLNISSNNLAAAGTQHGIELGLANDVGSFLEEPLYLIKWAVGGTNILQNMEGGEVYSDFYINYVTPALNNLIASGYIPVVYLVYIQGEKDTNEAGGVAAYSGRFDDWVTMWKAQLGSGMAFIPVEILDTGADEAAINAVFNAKAALESNMAVVDTSAATSSDALHFDYASLKVIANDVLTETGNLTGLQISSFNEYTAPTGNLVLSCRFDNSITDETGNHTLSSNGISYANGIWSGSANESVEFDTNTDYVLVPDANSLSFGDGSTDSPFSVSFLVNGDTIGGNTLFIFSKRGVVATNEREYNILINNTDNLQINLWDNSASAYIGRIGSTTLSSSTNYHFTITYDGGGSETGIKMYINGIEESSYTASNSGTYVAMENTTSDIYIGKAPYNTAASYDGRLDCLNLWDKELSASEVKNIATIDVSGNNVL